MVIDPKSIPMKKYYFGIMLLLTMVSYGQNNNTLSKQESPFKLYPNPVTNDVVYITTPTNGTKDILIFDVFGKTVLKDRIKSNSLNISRVLAGVYVLQVTEGKKTITRKLVVK